MYKFYRALVAKELSANTHFKRVPLFLLGFAVIMLVILMIFTPNDPIEWSSHFERSEFELHFEPDTMAKQSIIDGTLVAAESVMALGLLLGLLYAAQTYRFERANKSDLFFRSQPVADWQYLVAKLATALWVPAFFAYAAFLLSYVLVGLGVWIHFGESMLISTLPVVIWAQIKFLALWLLAAPVLASPTVLLLMAISMLTKRPILMLILVIIMVSIAEALLTHREPMLVSQFFSSLETLNDLGSDGLEAGFNLWGLVMAWIAGGLSIFVVLQRPELPQFVQKRLALR